jgi:translation initiation factor 2 subunit 2
MREELEWITLSSTMNLEHPPLHLSHLPTQPIDIATTMSDDPMNMFAGIKKKKKKQVNIADLDVEDGEPESQAPLSPAPTPVAADNIEEGADDDAVRPLEKDADLTLKEDEPLDFSDLKKKKKKKQVAIDLEDVSTPEEQEQKTNIAANVDKLGNTAEAEAVEGCV